VDGQVWVIDAIGLGWSPDIHQRLSSQHHRAIATFARVDANSLTKRTKICAIELGAVKRSDFTARFASRCSAVI
jgi:hypothetical protein